MNLDKLNLFKKKEEEKSVYPPKHATSEFNPTGKYDKADDKVRIVPENNGGFSDSGS